MKHYTVLALLILLTMVPPAFAANEIKSGNKVTKLSSATPTATPTPEQETPFLANPLDQIKTVFQTLTTLLETLTTN